jgi:hypothetical protein
MGVWSWGGWCVELGTRMAGAGARGGGAPGVGAGAGTGTAQWPWSETTLQVAAD